MATGGSDPSLECPVCYELLQVPKLLPCGHSTCSHCLLSWIHSGGLRGGCPLCRNPIFPPSIVQGYVHDDILNYLPTDFLTDELVRGHQVVSRSYTCEICRNKMSARCYCLQCQVKLCAKCTKHHRRLPASLNHSLHDLTTLTAEDLLEHYQPRCHKHADRTAAAYCFYHRELVCWECASSHNRRCAEVRDVSEVARDHRRQVDSMVRGWRRTEEQLTEQILTRRCIPSQEHKHLDEEFDKLEQLLNSQRRKLHDVIDKGHEANAQLEKIRTILRSHAAVMERVLKAPSDGMVVKMMKEMAPRSQEVSIQCQEAESLVLVPRLTLNAQSVENVSAALSSLGKMKVPSSTQHANGQQTNPSTPSAQTSSATATRTSASTPTYTTVVQIAQRSLAPSSQASRTPTSTAPAQVSPPTPTPAISVSSPPVQSQSSRPRTQGANASTSSTTHTSIIPVNANVIVNSTRVGTSDASPWTTTTTSTTTTNTNTNATFPTNTNTTNTNTTSITSPTTSTAITTTINIATNTTSPTTNTTSSTTTPPTTTANALNPSPDTPAHRPTGAALAWVLKVGDRVRFAAGAMPRMVQATRRDQGDPGPGTVIAIPSRIKASCDGDPQGWVDVRWGDGREWCCCMGRNGQYDLVLA